MDASIATVATAGEGACVDENTALGFLARGLSDERTRAVIAHAADCGSCRRFLATLASTGAATLATGTAMTASQLETIPLAGRDPTALLVELQAGECVDRYVIRRRIGVGAMGIVYAAFDPQLGREVALKILDRGAPGLDEARAMARVAHPNIVAVFDAGTFDARGFVAMELVRGTTLTQWLRTPRSRRAIVARFREAASGLAAVHAAGLIHGDFKPDNVLVGEDDRARVVDFGLAKASGEAQLGGTPAYMPPETLAGTDADARADQFSFCVALFEAMCDVRPFAGATIDELAAAARKGVTVPRRLPRGLRRILARGLASEPASRFDSMTTVARELARLERRSPALALGIGAGVVALSIAGSALVAQHARGKQTLDCARDADAIARTWNPIEKVALDLAFARVAQPSDARAFQRVAQLLDTRTASWRTHLIAACKAHERGDENERTYALRRDCFDAQRTSLAALLELFAAPDAQIVAAALQSAHAAFDVSRCAATIPPTTPSPRDPDGLGVRRALAEVRALQLVGKPREALARAEVLFARTRDPRLAAQVADQLASLLDDVGQARRAEDTLAAGIAAAERGGDDSMKATLLVRLVWVTGVSAGRFDEGERLGRLASAALERADDPELRAVLEYALGNIDDSRGRDADALAHFERALAYHEKLDGPDAAEAGPVLSALGLSAARMHRDREALAYFQRARAALETLYGPRSPMIALLLINVAQTQAQMGQLDESIATAREAVAMQERAFGADHVQTAMAVVALADVMKAARRYAEALALYRRAEPVMSRELGDDHPNLAVVWFGIGSSELELGHSQSALPWLERALATCERANRRASDCDDVRSAIARARR